MKKYNIKLFSHTFEIEGKVNGIDLQGNWPQKQRFQQRLAEAHYDGYFWLLNQNKTAPISITIQNYLLIHNAEAEFAFHDDDPLDEIDENSFFWPINKYEPAHELHSELTKRLAKNQENNVGLVQFSNCWRSKVTQKGHAISFTFIADEKNSEYHIIAVNRGLRFSADARYPHVSNELKPNQTFYFTFTNRQAFFDELKVLSTPLASEGRNTLSDIILKLLHHMGLNRKTNEYKKWRSGSRNMEAQENFSFENQEVGNCSFANTIPGWFFNMAASYMRENQCTFNEALKATKNYFDLCIIIDKTRQLATLAKFDLSDNSEATQLLTILIKKWIAKNDSVTKQEIHDIFQLMEWMSSDKYPAKHLKIPQGDVIKLKESIGKTREILSNEEKGVFDELLGTIAIQANEDVAVLAASSGSVAPNQSSEPLLVEKITEKDKQPSIPDTTLNPDDNQRLKEEVAVEPQKSAEKEELRTDILSATALIVDSAISHEQQLSENTPSETPSDEASMGAESSGSDEKRPLVTDSNDEEIIDIKRRLQEYINRINGYEISNPENKFKHGFRFFTTIQANNREANYMLAENLITKLDNGEQIASIFENDSLESFRKDFFRSKRLWFNNGIRSDELKGIIEDAQSSFKPKK